MYIIQQADGNNFELLTCKNQFPCFFGAKCNPLLFVCPSKALPHRRNEAGFGLINSSLDTTNQRISSATAFCCLKSQPPKNMVWLSGRFYCVPAPPSQ